MVKTQKLIIKILHQLPTSQLSLGARALRTTMWEVAGLNPARPTPWVLILFKKRAGVCIIRFKNSRQSREFLNLIIHNCEFFERLQKYAFKRVSHWN